ncbi:hypothetical protein EVAR_99106_1 [Eumeta japonica]|uniref:HTH psq-type domain-containing protein n=1 Tax=Eumeta variegata TaxID=151549 RepID=A0A4C1Z734_EUMVA|nr:hypothetical protein EVAR_99106_1 [Eumeta japonica]
MQTIIDDRLSLRKRCPRWVPHKLADEQKDRRMPRINISPKPKRKRQQWDPEKMKLAVQAVQTKAMGYKKAVKMFSVPRTTKPTGTSYARVQGFNRAAVNEFFDILEAEYSKTLPCRSNFNVDETGLTIVQSKIPAVIGKRLMKGAPPGAIGKVHPSGWIQAHLFTEWFKHFLKRQIQQNSLQFFSS